MTAELNRRQILLALLLGTGLIACPATGIAKDGSDDGGGDNSGSSGSSGDDDSDDDDDDDSEAKEAKDAVAAGQAVPLRRLLNHLQQNYPGKVLDIDLKHSSGRYQYRVKILQSSGKVLRLRLDAATLQPR